ncbi:MAG: hypothetical protein ACD_37C00082G0002 [uncultured bacterium]|nr:MAG: hypothetical protein ACD_37C00082G0002 [uncultured bacterium]
MHLERHTLGSRKYYTTDYRTCQVPTMGFIWGKTKVFPQRFSFEDSEIGTPNPAISLVRSLL